ncbi:MAG: hypothetical protein E7456_06345 [Ruminococcaceae bacterium]|nr:hypothetical protein [Oscillospiraceae bacterium]
MKEQKKVNIMEKVSEKYIKEAAPGKKKKELKPWVKWLAAVACVAAMVGGSYLLQSSDEPAPADEETVVADVAYGFTMNDCTYFPISFDERIRYGLVPEDAVGLTEENTYKITEADLGELMGSVEACGDESLVGASVYRFAKYPEYDSVCIVEAEGKYSFYTASGMVLENEIGKSSDFVLEAYNMPQSVTRVTVQTGDWKQVMEITDRDTINAICSIMAGKENIGLKEHEKLFAQLWYDTYGNDDVYYDEASGSMIYREAQENPPKAVTYTDTDGNEVTYYESDTEDYDKAHALWGEGERVVTITTDRGFEFYMNFRPSVCTISFYDGYYILTENEAEDMNSFLDVK